MGCEEPLRRYEASGGHLAAANAEGPRRPSLRVAVIARVGSRIDAFALFGMNLGEAHVLRNAGSVVTDDVIWSVTRDADWPTTFTDREFAEELADETGMRPVADPCLRGVVSGRFRV